MPVPCADDTYSNVLTILFLLLPELLRLSFCKAALLHGNLDQRILDAFAHALTTTADEYTAIQSIDNEPDNVGLQANLVLYILGLAHPTTELATLHNLFDL